MKLCKSRDQLLKKSMILALSGLAFLKDRGERGRQRDTLIMTALLPEELQAQRLALSLL